MSNEHCNNCFQYTLMCFHPRMASNKNTTLISFKCCLLQLALTEQGSGYKNEQQNDQMHNLSEKWNGYDVQLV